MVGFDGGVDSHRLLNESKDDPASRALENARPVAAINADLTAEADLTQAHRLREHAGICFQGPVKVGPFEIEADEAARMLSDPNPHGRPNSDVVHPWLMPQILRDEVEACISSISVPCRSMRLVCTRRRSSSPAFVVRPLRDQNNDRQRRTYWWSLGRSGGEFRDALRGTTRMIPTPRVAKHRIFVFERPDTVPDSRVFAFTRDDDYFFGVLHSRVHEAWSLATSSRHGVGNDPTYNNTTCFETFPFPWPPGQEPADDPRVEAIAEAARELVAQRDAWLHPAGAARRS